MKKIYLFCSAGMSTSMLASKMQSVADAHNVPVKVAAHPHNKIGRSSPMTVPTAFFWDRR